MKMRREASLALVNMLIFLFIFTIMAGSILALLSSHTRFMESNIRRIKAYYVAEAGNVAAVDLLRRGQVPTNIGAYWMFNSAGNPIGPQSIAVVTYTVNPVNCFGDTCVRSSTDYTTNW